MAISIRMAEMKSLVTSPQPLSVGANHSSNAVKADSKDAKHLDDAKYNATGLYYASLLKPQALKTFLKKTKLSDAKKLEEFFHAHRYIRRAYEWRATAANWTNPLWIFFVVKNAPKGIVDLIHFFNPAFEVDNDDATAAGWTVAIATTLFWMLLFVPERAALESTVDFVMRKPVKQRLEEWLQRFLENHWQGFKESVEFVVSRGILYAVNLNSGVTVAVGTAAWYAGMPTPGLLAIALFFGYMSGVAFFHHVSDKDFYRFIRHMKKDIPWTMGEIFRQRSFPFWIREFARQVKIFTQFLAAGFIRSFIQFFAIARDASAFTQGYWFDPWFMAAITLVHSGFLYLSTYKHYLDSSLKINKIILSRFKNELLATIKSEVMITPGQLAKEIKRLIPSMTNIEIESEIKKLFPKDEKCEANIVTALLLPDKNADWIIEKVNKITQTFLIDKKEKLFRQMQNELQLKWGYEIKEDPISLFMFLFWLGMGSFTAWRFAVPALIDVIGEGAAYAISFAGLALVPSTISALSDQARIHDDLLLKYLEGERNQKPSIWGRLGIGIVLLAAFFVFANAASGITSQLGMMSDIFSAVTSLAVILILDKEVNNGMYYVRKAAETLSGRFTDLKTRCERWSAGSDVKIHPSRALLFSTTGVASVNMNASPSVQATDIKPTPSTKRLGVNL